MNDAYGVSRSFLRNRWGIKKIGGRISVAIVMVLWKKVIRRKEEQRDAAKTGAASDTGNDKRQNRRSETMRRAYLAVPLYII